MRCIIPAVNIKGSPSECGLRFGLFEQDVIFIVSVFVRALHALARIGDDLYLDSQVDGLALRTTNVSRSAFASFLFDPNFFVEYNDKEEEEQQNDKDEDASNASPVVAKCKITMKVQKRRILLK